MAKIIFDGKEHDIPDSVLRDLVRSSRGKLVMLKLQEKNMFPKRDADLLKWLQDFCFDHQIY